MWNPLSISLLVGLLSGTGVLPTHATPSAPVRTDAVRAQAPAAAAHIEVMVINAGSGPGGLGPGLENLPQLTQPPFTMYTRMTLVSRVTLPLGATPAIAALPNGNNASITSSGRQPNGRYQVNVQLTFNGRSHAIAFAAAPGDPFFTAQTTSADTAQILGFIVRP